MITGDHPLTAFSIAKDLKLVKNHNQVVTGIDIDKAYVDKTFADTTRKYDLKKYII